MIYNEDLEHVKLATPTSVHKTTAYTNASKLSKIFSMLNNRDHCYLLTRFASAGSIFSIVSVSPSTSSSSECSLDDSLVVGLNWAPAFFCMAGKEGIPSGPPASLSGAPDKSYPDPVQIIMINIILLMITLSLQATLKINLFHGKTVTGKNPIHAWTVKVKNPILAWK